MKHTLRLKNSLAICLYLVLAVVITGCNKFFPSDGRYMIIGVKETENYTDYYIEQVKGFGHAFYRDSVGKYHVGDTIGLYPITANISHNYMDNI